MAEKKLHRNRIKVCEFHISKTIKENKDKCWACEKGMKCKKHGFEEQDTVYVEKKGTMVA